MVGVAANCWYAYAAETNQGGGVGGTRASPTAPTNGTLTGCSYPLENQQLPFEKFKREAIHPMGTSANQKVIVNMSLDKKDFTIKQLVQTRIWAASAVAVTAGATAVGYSYVFHFENGAEQYDAFGCYIKHYKVSVIVKDFVYEEITFGYDKVQTASALTKVAFITAAPLVWKDVAQPSLDGTAFVDAHEESFEITNVFTEKDIFGTWRGILPLLDERNIRVEIKGHANVGSKIANLSADAVSAWTVVLGDLVGASGAAKDITLTNMKISDESEFTEFPEKGLVDYTYVLDAGGLPVITVEA